MTLEPIIDIFTFSHCKIRELVEGLSDEEMVLQFDFEKKHALWVLGHLAVVRDYILRWSGREPLCPDSWDDWFGNNPNPITGDVSVKRSLLMRTYEQSFRSVVPILERIDDDMFDRKITETHHDFPCKRHGIIFETTIHEGIHLGQLRTLIAKIESIR